MSRKGIEGFENFYASAFGERWPALRAALLGPVRQVARLNRFAGESSGSSPSGQVANCPALYLEPGERFAVLPAANGVLSHYVLDPASIYAAVALGCVHGDRVLDLCAAPGGKSLILAEGLAESGELTCNEMSDRRRARLRAVLEDYLPREVLSRVKVTAHDGARWCLYEKQAYDRILIDAPCSGERHLLENTDELKLWSPARSKNLAVRQYALLASAHQVVKVGGRMVYSTCSLSPLENDAVVARLLKKRPGSVRVLQAKDVFPAGLDLPGETTEHGHLILPDRTGFGPIYFAILEKTAASQVE